MNYKYLYYIFLYNIQELNVLPDNNENATKDWNNLLDDMEKLMLIKSLREDKLIFGITAFIKKDLGKSFVESAVISLGEMLAKISNKINMDPYTQSIKK